MNETIYVSIPSLYDEELVPTIEDMFLQAEYPDRVFVGISLADISDDMLPILNTLSEKFSNLSYRFELLTTENKNHLRVGYGRLKAMSMYASQDYILQTDSHAAFGKNWDTNLIELHKQSQDKTKNNKVVITGYAGSYAYSEELGRHLDPYEPGIAISGYSPKYPVFVSYSKYNGVIPGWTVASEIDLKNMNEETLIPAIKFNANFAFSDKQFAAANTISENIEFFEEELTQTILLIKAGFSLVFPNVDYALVCHLYLERMTKDVRRRGGRRSSEMYIPLGIQTTNYLVKDNYLSFLDDPNNAEAIKIYQQYARMNMKFGPMMDGIYVPKYFINSEVRHDRK